MNNYDDWEQVRFNVFQNPEAESKLTNANSLLVHQNVALLFKRNQPLDRRRNNPFHCSSGSMRPQSIQFAPFLDIQTLRVVSDRTDRSVREDSDQTRELYGEALEQFSFEKPREKFCLSASNSPRFPLLPVSSERNT
ncbi:Hypothetical protein NTJ_11147 [Nesidiocoris tenuis]|uniref:Uncharacterized protein n=1 Tax=Nesidiocoris tenuis TaxID=355587 RepID=A0ABN7B6E6_9HEMI|nr:Hypothetical protein NTJ_11147 [Nesidiocoris tenuis]